MKAKQIREKLMNRKAKIELLDISLPDLPELDGQIYVMEISGQDVTWAKEKASDANGNLDETKSNAATIARSLISKEEYDANGTIERIFSDDDIDFIAGTKDISGFGSTILLTLVSRVNHVSGMTQDFLSKLAPSSTPTTSTGSPSA